VALRLAGTTIRVVTRRTRLRYEIIRLRVLYQDIPAATIIIIINIEIIHELHKKKAKKKKNT